MARTPSKDKDASPIKLAKRKYRHISNKTSKSPQKKSMLPKVLHAGYTEDQYLKYLSLIKKYTTKTSEELVEAIKINTDYITGDHKSLLDRVVDGEVLGCIPKCPKCGKGYLKYNYKLDVYLCQGSNESSELKMCDYKASSREVPRSPWVKIPKF